MRYSALFVAAAATAVSAQQTPCNAEYAACVAAGTPEVACGCRLATCSGEDAARIRSFCATATANLNLPPAASTTSAPVITGTIVQPSGAPQITAPAGSLPLGAACGASEQCGAGVDCFGSTAGTIRRCGNFNAQCKSDSQCAYNTCNNGLCNGFLASSAYPANTVSSSASAAPTTFACNPAHQYPAGQVCTEIGGSLTLITTTGTAAYSPTTAPSPQTTGYACNPAHQYGNGQVCTEKGGSLTLITTSTGTGIYVPRPTASANTTAPITPYVGGASAVGASLSGFAAVVAGLAAWVL